MLWIIQGDDSLKKHTEIQKLKDKVSPDVFFQYDAISPQVSLLKDSHNLFNEKHLILVSEVIFEDFSKDIGAYVASPHYFVFCVSSLSSLDKKKLEHVTIIDCVSLKKTKEFNLFDISDAFISKNKKELWVLYQKSLREGVVPQKIISVLLWQIRVLYIVSQKEEKEAGLKPFVVTKAKKALNSFSSQDLEQYMKELVSMYHDAKRGIDLSNSFERFILSL